jgi:hypothetical protein
MDFGSGRLRFQEITQRFCEAPVKIVIQLGMLIAAVAAFIPGMLLPPG